MRIAITREVGPALERCELTHLPRRTIDLAEARRQHAAYEACLRRAGCAVRTLAAEADLPDSVFVEDTALVLDELAVLARPGAASRRGETGSIAAALAAHRGTIEHLRAPATLDGGDVLVAGRAVYVGRSSRTNAEAVRQLRAMLEPYGYRVSPVPVDGCLHLKSAATLVAPQTVLLQPRWIDAEAFGSMERIEVDPSEPAAANALLIGDGVVYSRSHPRTRERLEARGIRTLPVGVRELEKAEGAVTCCSLVFESPAPATSAPR